MLGLAGLTLLVTLLGALPAQAGDIAPARAMAGDALAVAEPTPTASAAATPAASPAQATPAPAPSPSPYTWPNGDPCPLPAPLPTPPEPGATPRPLPLCPAQLSGNPVDILAWLFTPIFQALFLGLVVFYRLTGDIGIAIILLTLVIKTILIPLFRKQIVSQRRMQLLQPEMRAVQQKFKGNRAKISEETMRLYRERGINPAAGCLPALLQLFLLIPIYQVVSQGLSAPDISSMLQLFGQPVLDVPCQVSPPSPDVPCINPTVSWLGDLPANRPEVLFSIPLPFMAPPGFGISALALLAAFLQLIQTRMMVPNTNDPQTRTQQRIFLVLPLFSIIYGAFLPAGLFLYWIVFTAYSIIQQYLIAGWGALFPLFGWNPGFARNHSPRFPVPDYKPPRAESGESRKDEPRRSPTDRAAGTIRPARSRGRTSRRGRRR
ncbi:MAG TPA: YidC/Oxa1 family membrane protein insertase [Candidatus Limnocylindria bacterium]|nr:YidC/Oxa1 family membrane protein insertase [Candidatus Limnocylindria bacterium]